MKKQKEPLKVGDRVKFYHSYSPNPYVCKILELFDDGMLLIKDEACGLQTAHPKQCRRLVKKTPREFWISQGRSKTGTSRFWECCLYEEDPKMDDYIHVREVLKK